jgi:hypothetical protein
MTFLWAEALRSVSSVARRAKDLSPLMSFDGQVRQSEAARADLHRASVPHAGRRRAGRTTYAERLSCEPAPALTKVARQDSSGRGLSPPALRAELVQRQILLPLVWFLWNIRTSRIVLLCAGVSPVVAQNGGGGPGPGRHGLGPQTRHVAFGNPAYPYGSLSQERADCAKQSQAEESLKCEVSSVKWDERAKRTQFRPLSAGTGADCAKRSQSRAGQDAAGGTRGDCAKQSQFGRGTAVIGRQESVVGWVEADACDEQSQSAGRPGDCAKQTQFATGWRSKGGQSGDWRSRGPIGPEPIATNKPNWWRQEWTVCSFRHRSYERLEAKRAPEKQTQFPTGRRQRSDRAEQSQFAAPGGGVRRANREIGGPGGQFPAGPGSCAKQTQFALGRPCETKPIGERTVVGGRWSVG